MKTNQNDEESIVDEIEQLQIEYRATLLEKCAKVVDLLTEVQQNAHQPGWTFKLDQWKNCRDYTHKIAGSAGTYGFVALSEALRFIEDRIMDGSFVPLSGPSIQTLTTHWKAFVDATNKHYLSLPTEVGYSETLMKADKHLRSLWKKMENELIQEINLSRSKTRDSTKTKAA